MKLVCECVVGLVVGRRVVGSRMFGSSGWQSNVWVEWLGRVVGSRMFGSSGWVHWLAVEWLGRVVGSSGWQSSVWVEWLAVVKASDNEFAAPAEGGILLSVYLPFTIFSIYSLSCRFIGYSVFEIKLICGRVRYELITFIWRRG